MGRGSRPEHRGQKCSKEEEDKRETLARQGHRISRGKEPGRMVRLALPHDIRTGLFRREHLQGLRSLMTAESDAMHCVLVQRADMLEGCPKGSVEEAELEGIVDAIESYEAKRWPEGKVPGGKG